MLRLRAFARFWYEFIVGDDWRVAVAVLAALAVTALVAAAGLPAWWVLPRGRSRGAATERVGGPHAPNSTDDRLVQSCASRRTRGISKATAAS